MPVRILFGCVFAIASVAIAFYAAVRQEQASLWSWGACLALLLAAVASLRTTGRARRR